MLIIMNFFRSMILPVCHPPFQIYTFPPPERNQYSAGICFLLLKVPLL